MIFFRWVERIDGIGRLLQSYVPTHKAISKIAKSRPSNTDNAFHKVPWDTKTRVMASGLKSTMENFLFIVSMVVMKEILAYLLALTISLQGIYKYLTRMLYNT